jgi:NADPH-dependent glutamate synthase beta subunit-like oxidoreductase/NAD(P)H-flavin reductase
MPGLAFGLRFEDLYRRDGLQRIDKAFGDRLARADPDLAGRFMQARDAPDSLADRDEAALLLALAPQLDSFIGTLFGIPDELGMLRANHEALAPLVRAKWKFVRRKALLPWPDEASLGNFDPDEALARLEQWLGCPFEELAFAQAIAAWQAEGLSERLDLAARYCAWAVHSEAGQVRHRGQVLFRHPQRTDPAALLPAVVEGTDARGHRVSVIDTRHLRRRDGFGLTDPGTDLRGALDEVNYCLWCHAQGTDSCSKGLRAPGAGKPGGAPAADAAAGWRRSALGTTLAGCPLEERISEFQQAKARGHAIAALAIIVIDNPMVAATGHRICNECVKACIYQQQTPVDIPQAETRTLRDVLALPWGFEIYSLLTRWNPLNLRRPLPAPASGRKVLVAGMGPAGFTLAHHLLNDGHAVVGIDGLKIEPLDARLNGIDAEGRRVAFEPIEDAADLIEDLAARVPGGFGGVAEYGITARWDKNLLALVRLLLERREDFLLAGGVRFGGTLDAAGAFALGFDHVALATGAGRPTLLDIPGGLARGVRTASDFLMALQLGGAARAESLANLQLRLPAVVIGGGLTAFDTATEALAYYPAQVEKFLARHEAIAARDGEAAARAGWGPEEREIAEEFLAHARELRAERERAARAGEPPRLLERLHAWGGVTVVYRRRLIDSPAYRLNHEEVGHAFEEGIAFAGSLSPVRIDVDAHGAVAAITLRHEPSGASPEASSAATPPPGTLERWPVRSVFVAAGTRPNTVPAREDPAHFRLDGEHFQAIDPDTGMPVRPPRDVGGKPARADVLLSRLADGRTISFFGDLHPAYAGSVVRAMASARQGHAVLSRELGARPAASPQPFADFARRLDGLLRARVERVERLAPGIVEVVVHAPLAAQRFAPGQFYRLQNFEALAPQVAPGGLRTRLAMEGLALTGAWVDRARGLVATIVLEMGGSSDLCAALRPGEPVVLMGPTGSPTVIGQRETVVLVGGGLGNAVLFSIGEAMRAAGCRVLYFAGYRRTADRFRTDRIEAAADAVVWCCDEAPGFVPGRAGDRTFAGNLVEAMLAWARGEFGDLGVAPAQVDRLLAIGSDRMMAAVAAARLGPLATWLRPDLIALASVNSPMQCMLKEICAQCLQTRIDPRTGETRQVFSCFEQDQPLGEVDFTMLDQRLRQNALQERQTRVWLAACAIARPTP